ncbi:hypothetical protein JX266_011041 [Neoarthrinium moseri]|nr:hypothetical protein JX266_011041 [Neoarthrinium moseri]
MATKQENLTHEEIWDDSSLVNSWNDALEEYKKYHSIHSKGGNVDDILQQNEAGHGSDAKNEEHPTAPAKQDEAGSEMSLTKRQDGIDEGGNPDGLRSHSSAQIPAGIPAPLLGSVRDESLKKLLMSWYYAGYYTGYYEGQQAQQQ